MKKVAVILSGCGVYDGAEIHEAVLTLLSLSRHGASYQCFAPDIEQMHVIDHLSGQEMQPARNVLTEAARIARGEIQPLSELMVDDFDGLILPGGFGAAKNLSDFAVKGAQSVVNEEVLCKCQGFAKAEKAAGYMCIAPALLPAVYGQGVKLTIGHDADTVAAIEAMGGVHQTCNVKDIVVDDNHKLVTTPAYMLAENIAQAAEGIEKLVAKVLALA